MTPDASRSAFERLKRRYDHTERVCPECGYEDPDGGWESETDGHVVAYHHECPNCGAVREHVVQLHSP